MKRIITAFLVGISLVYALTYINNPTYQQPVIVTPVVKTYAVPAEIQPIVDRLGITDRTVEIRTDFPCIVGSKACFDTAIHFPLSTLKEPELKQNTILAHEYMHYVYDNQPESVKKRVGALARTLYEQTPRFQARMNWYEDHNFLTEDELIAVGCTEVDDSVLPAELLEYCTKHVPNRLALPSTIR